MYATISMTVDIPVYPERVYRAWMDSYEHSRFTGKAATIAGQAGGKFTALAGAVESIIQVATPFDRIVQTWKVSQFPQNAPDSSIELSFEPTCTGAQVTLTHSGVDAAITRQMMQWWEDTYFRPLRDYFDALIGDYVSDMGDG
ncbi:MAG TPA: SRPBCC domain-containing protein [Bellilinea sp.]|nr:SRPBCC domain-containing protein [Bellilinea sp.]